MTGRASIQNFCRTCSIASLDKADASSTHSHGGLGIGLTIVRHIVELHGGRVQAESAGEGKGDFLYRRAAVRATQTID